MQRNWWADQVFRPLLLTAILVCLVLALIWFGRSLAPDWRGNYLLVGAILVIIETIYSTRVLNQPRLQGISTLRYRLVEWGILALVLKLVTLIDQPRAALEAAWQTFVHSPLTFVFPVTDLWCSFRSIPCPDRGDQSWPVFFSGDYILLLGLAVVIGYIVQSTLSEFESIYDPESFTNPSPPSNVVIAPRLGRTYVVRALGNITPIDRLTDRFFWGGAFMLAVYGFTLLAHQNNLATGVTSPLILPQLAFNGLAYFVLGLLLISQIRLAGLMTLWHTRQTRVVEGLGKRWARYGLVFLGLFGVLALMLPTGYSLTLLDATRLVLIWLLNLIAQIFQVIWLLVVLALSTLFRFDVDGSFPPPPPPPLPFTTDYSAPQTPFPWLEILRSLLFWWIFIFGLVYVARSYVADHPELLAFVKRFTPLWWLIGLGATVIVWLIELVRTLFDLRPQPIAAQSTEAAAIPTRRPRWRPTQLKRLSERELIFYYYFDMLQQADRYGFARQRTETPLEYQGRLGQLLPLRVAEIQLLTDAFVQARYSRNRFDLSELSLVKEGWQQIGFALAERHSLKQPEQNQGGYERV